MTQALTELPDDNPTLQEIQPKINPGQRYVLPMESPGYLYEIVASHLIIRISEGDLAPNVMLPAEGRFAREYGISLGTIRNATRLLQHRGLLVTLRSKGNYISKEAPGIATDLLERNKDDTSVEQARLIQFI